MYIFSSLSLRRFFPFSSAILCVQNAWTDRTRRGGDPRDLLFPPFVEELTKERERERSERTVGGRVGQTGHGYATDGVVRGQKPDIADRSTRSAPLTGILVT